MTNPLATAGAGSPPTVNVGGGPDFSLVFQALLASRARKQRQAEESLGLVPQGATFKELSPESQKQVVRATGRKWQPDEVVSQIPLTPDEAATSRLIKGLGLDPSSTLAMGLQGALAARIATGKPSDIATPEQLSVTQETAAATGRAGLSKAQADEAQAGAFKSAVGKLKTAGQGGATAAQPEFTQEELAAYQHFNNFVPGQAVADQLTSQARAEVMKQALRLAADPDSASFARILKPLGVTPSDAIGAFALGIGSVLETAINRKAQIDIAAAQSKGAISEIAAKALFGTAEEISKRMGGAYSPSFIAAAMEGDPKVLATEEGKLVQRFTSAGFFTSLTELAAKGDPAALSMKQLLEIARIPQIASNPQLLGKYSNLAQDALASTLTRTFTGMDRPTEEGKEQQAWDAVQAMLWRKTAGVFSYDKDKILGVSIPFTGDLNITPQGGALEEQTRQRAYEALPDATKTRMEDAKIVEETLKALQLLGDSVTTDTTGGR